MATSPEVTLAAEAREAAPRPEPRATPAVPSARRNDLLPVGPVPTVPGWEASAAVNSVRLLMGFSFYRVRNGRLRKRRTDTVPSAQRILPRFDERMIRGRLE